MTIEPEAVKKTSTWRTRLRAWISPCFAALIVLAYVAISQHFLVPGLREPDTAGYLWMAEKLAAFELPVKIDQDPFLHQSHVWVENPRGELTPKYSPGLPAFMAIGIWLGGETGAFAINIFAGAMALLGVYWLAGLWAGPRARVPAMLALFFNTAFLTYTNYPLAHAADLAAITCGAFFLWRWMETRGWGSAVGAGLLFGFACTVRPSSALLGVVVLLGVVGGWRRDGQRPWGRAALLLGCYAFFPLLNSLYNWRVYGSPWVSGYGLSEEQTAFSLGGMLRNLDWTLKGLAGQLLYLYFGMGLVGMLIVPARIDRLMRLSWWVPLWLLYASYYWAFEHLGMAFLRFYICLLPVFIVSSFGLIEQLKLSRRHYWSVVTAVLLVTAALSVRASISGLKGMVAGTASQRQATAAERVVAAVPADAIVFAESSVAHRIGRGTQIRLYDLAAFNRHRTREILREEPSDPRMQPKRREEIQAFYDAHGDVIEAKFQELVEASLAAGRTVAIVAPTHLRHHLTQLLGIAYTLETIDEWIMPVERWKRQGRRFERETAEEPWTLQSVTKRQEQ